MAERITLARPYAKAIFMLAGDANARQTWSENLETLAELVKHEEIAPLLNDPRISGEQLLGLMQSLLGEKFGEEGLNLVHLLIQNKRLDLAPLIAEQYEALRTEHEGVADVDVVAAMPLTKEQLNKLEAALTRRLGSKVRLHAHIDESLIGGFLIRTGDMVIDGSVRDKLSRLSSALVH